MSWNMSYSYDYLEDSLLEWSEGLHKIPDAGKKFLKGIAFENNYFSLYIGHDDERGYFIVKEVDNNGTNEIWLEIIWQEKRDNNLLLDRRTVKGSRYPNAFIRNIVNYH